jgi:hypothetical protein
MPSLYLQKEGLPKTPYRHWKDIENRRKFARLLGEHLGYKSSKDWLQITKHHINNFGGNGILQLYESSPSKFTRSLVPGCADLADWMFVSKPQRTWALPENARSWFEHVISEKGWKYIDDLYGITQEDFKTYDGIGLLDRHGYTIIKVLGFAYPQRTWDPLRFNRVPNNYWSTPEAVLLWVKTLMSDKGWKCPADLYQIRATDFRYRPYGWSVYISCGNSIMNILRIVFPEFPWDDRKFNIFQSSNGAIEWIEFRQVTDGPIAHARNGGEERVPGTKMSLDGNLISMKEIAYEFQGSYWHGDPRTGIDPDSTFRGGKTTFRELYENTLKKTARLKSMGYTVIEMWEYDWERGKKALINLQRALRSRKSL